MGRRRSFIEKLLLCVCENARGRVLSESLVLFIILLFLMKKGGETLLSAERLQENLFQRTFEDQVSSILGGSNA